MRRTSRHGLQRRLCLGGGKCGARGAGRGGGRGRQQRGGGRPSLTSPRSKFRQSASSVANSASSVLDNAETATQVSGATGATGMSPQSRKRCRLSLASPRQKRLVACKHYLEELSPTNALQGCSMKVHERP